MVQATMPTVTTDCSRPSMLRSVRKFGTSSDTSAKATMKMTTRPCSPSRIFFNWSVMARSSGCDRVGCFLIGKSGGQDRLLGELVRA